MPIALSPPPQLRSICRETSICASAIPRLDLVKPALSQVHISYRYFWVNCVKLSSMPLRLSRWKAVILSPLVRPVIQVKYAFRIESTGYINSSHSGFN